LSPLRIAGSTKRGFRVSASCVSNKYIQWLKYPCVSPKERSILRGMVNCYKTCGENFERTVEMVANHRGLRSEQVKAVLVDLRSRWSSEPEYVELRKRLPQEFPV
jgi:hypothetical protein